MTSVKHLFLSSHAGRKSDIFVVSTTSKLTLKNGSAWNNSNFWAGVKIDVQTEKLITSGSCLRNYLCINIFCCESRLRFLPVITDDDDWHVQLCATPHTHTQALTSSLGTYWKQWYGHCTDPPDTIYGFINHLANLISRLLYFCRHEVLPHKKSQTRSVCRKYFWINLASPDMSC